MFKYPVSAGCLQEFVAKAEAEAEVKVKVENKPHKTYKNT
jgi:hypothetical protein